MSAFVSPLPSPKHGCLQHTTNRTFASRPPSWRPLRLRPPHVKQKQANASGEAQPTSKSSSSAASLPALQSQLLSALSPLNRGLDIDADSSTMDDQEAQVEDLIEAIEDLNSCEIPVRDPRMSGDWKLAYTSSSITRYFGGVTGWQRVLPEGKVGEIVQSIDAENGTSQFRETILFELPFVRTSMKSVALAFGKLRATSEARQSWDPEYVKFYFFKQFADSWKTLRAFQISDTTFLDRSMRITRGQTGSVNVFVKSNEEGT